MIDVVMTVWNTPGEWVGKAIRSAAGQPARSIIVVDDGSTDPTTNGALLAADMMAPEYVRIEWIDHAGIGPASNFGISLGTSPFVARLDADDVLMSDTLRVLWEYLNAHPHVDVVSGAMHYIRPDGSRFGQVSPPVMHASPKHQSRITHSGCMFRRELWERVGGYPDMKFADWHFWEACEKAGARFSVLPHHVIERRIHPDSFSFEKSKHLQSWWRKAKA